MFSESDVSIIFIKEFIIEFESISFRRELDDVGVCIFEEFVGCSMDK